MKINKDTEYDGKVLWYSDRLGYGLICGRDCEIYFIYYKDIISSSMDDGRHRRHLLKDEKVMFDWCWKPDTNNTKRQAINLKVVNDIATQEEAEV